MNISAHNPEVFSHAHTCCLHPRPKRAKETGRKMDEERRICFLDHWSSFRPCYLSRSARVQLDSLPLWCLYGTADFPSHCASPWLLPGDTGKLWAGLVTDSCEELWVIENLSVMWYRKHSLLQNGDLCVNVIAVFLPVIIMSRVCCDSKWIRSAQNKTKIVFISKDLFLDVCVALNLTQRAPWW